MGKYCVRQLLWIYTYKIYNTDGIYTGCAWALSNSEIITCAHVAHTLSIDYYAKSSFGPNVTVLFRVAHTTGLENQNRDASLLTSSRLTNNDVRSPLNHGIRDPDLGQTVVAFGFPEDKLTLGDYSIYEIVGKLPNGWFAAQIRSPQGSELRAGYSGSPVWDHILRCVVGIVVGVDPHRPKQIAYIVPPSVLREQVGVPADKYPEFGPLFYDHIASSRTEADLSRTARYLAEAVEKVGDSVQRYWLYTSLGELAPNNAARTALLGACSFESDDFARRGAMEALLRYSN